MPITSLLATALFTGVTSLCPIPPYLSLVRASCTWIGEPDAAEFARVVSLLDRVTNPLEAAALRRQLRAAESCDVLSTFEVRGVIFGHAEAKLFVARSGHLRLGALRSNAVGRIDLSELRRKEGGYFFVRKGADGIDGEWAAVTKTADLHRMLPFPGLFPMTLGREDLNGTRMRRPSQEDCDAWMQAIKNVAEAGTWPKQREMLVRFGGFKNEALASWAVYALRTFAPDKETTAILRERLKDKKVSGLVVAATDMTFTRWLGKEWTDSAERADRLAAALLSERATPTQVGFLVGHVVGIVETPTAVSVVRKVLAGDPTDEGPMVVRQYLGNMAGTARQAGKANEQLVENLFADLAAEPYPKAVRDAAAAELKSLRQR